MISSLFFFFFFFISKKDVYSKSHLMKKHKAEQRVHKKKQTDQICPCPQKFANYAPSKYTTLGTTGLNSKLVPPTEKHFCNRSRQDPRNPKRSENQAPQLISFFTMNNHLFCSLHCFSHRHEPCSSINISWYFQ